MAASRAHEARSEGQGAVGLWRLATTRKVVLPRTAPGVTEEAMRIKSLSMKGTRVASVPIADTGGGLSFRAFIAGSICVELYGWAVLGGVPEFATCEARRIREPSCLAFQAP